MDKLIVGLGNPGMRYRGTKHNAGFWVVDALARREAIAWHKRRFSALCGRGRIGGQPVVLCKPLTYMNLCGAAVYQCAAYFKIPITDVLVVVDDAALPLGGIRLRPDGSAGGHKGLISIIDHLGARGFARLRLGIGGVDREEDLAAYVLQPFATRTEKLAAQQMVATAVNAAACWARDGITAAMNRFNRGPEHTRTRRSHEKEE